MPRSFLVKKYFSNKKPCYKESQLESQTGKLFSLSEVERLDLSCRVNPRHSLKESLTRMPSDAHQSHVADKQDVFLCS